MQRNASMIEVGGRGASKLTERRSIMKRSTKIAVAAAAAASPTPIRGVLPPAPGACAAVDAAVARA
jgi:hypothetical protein